MADRLVLTEAHKRRFGPGVERDVPALEIMGFSIHREPTFDDATGDQNGWQAEGSYIEVRLVGDFGAVETVRIAEGQEALTLIGALNTANFTQKELRQHLIEQVMQEPGFEGTIQ